ncbi:MAG TPA: PD-(D/E)XK nuclease family protein [Tissierellaceae bacterium]|nr:PD-(D/E)XK nuclease family protein [Tissierellaceae bacterium]
MARKTKEQLEQIMKKHRVERIWSYSRYNCYKNSSFEYFLRYVKKEKPTRDNIYSYLGSCVHDLLESFYDGSIKYEDMIHEFDTAFLNAELAGLKFDRTDDVKNDNISRKYKACVRHFLQNHISIERDMALEEYILIKVGKFLFGGYFDAVHKDKDGNYVITDWKTSTIYTGKKIDQEKNQLVLYAEGLRQMGVSIEKLKIRWCFIKYLNITMPLKNGNTRTTRAERHAWFGKIKNNVKMWLKDTNRYSDEEIEDMLNYSLEFDTIDNLPEDIQKLYTIEDCYVYANFNEEEIDKLKEDIYSVLTEIYKREKEYEETGSDKAFWEEVTDRQSYYFANLCSYNASQHLPYQEYLNKLEIGIDDEYKTDRDVSEVDDDWMSELGLI